MRRATPGSTTRPSTWPSASAASPRATASTSASSRSVSSAAMEVLSSRVLIRPVDPDRSHRFYGEVLGLAVYREFGDGPERGVVYFLGGGFVEISGRAEGVTSDQIRLWLQVRDIQ